MTERLIVDGTGLKEPMSGIGTYTSRLVDSMTDERPSSTVVLSSPNTGAARHLIWPLRLRRSHADVFLGCLGQLPLGGVGMPSVITVHDLAIFRRPDWFPGRQWFSTRIVVPTSIRRATAIIAVSKTTGSDLLELFGVPDERVHVVPLAADQCYRPLSGNAVAETKRRLGLPDRFILFVSTIEPRKNVLTLVKAWRRLRDRPPLVLAGRWGWHSPDVRKQLESAGARVLGSVKQEDMASLYNLATCLAHPAWYEGFGLTPLEAMACGTPTIVSSAGALPEVVGAAGLLVDPADVEGWTRALERVLEDGALRARQREAGLRRASELSWQRTAQLTWRVVDRVRGQTSRRPVERESRTGG